MRTITYVVLRYRPDLAAADYINIGVVMVSPRDERAFSRIDSSTDRAKQLFPGLNAPIYQALCGLLQHTLGQIKPLNPVPTKNLRARRYALEALPADGSSFQWSPEYEITVTDNMLGALDQLYNQHVLGVTHASDD